MSSDPKDVHDALHETTASNLPGNFDPQSGKWESTDDKSEKPRTKLVFDPETKKLLALTPEQAAARAARQMDKFVGVDMARSGFFNLYFIQNYRYGF